MPNISPANSDISTLLESKVAAVNGTIEALLAEQTDIHEDLKTAEKWVGQFREWKVIKEDEGAEEIMAKGPYCKGCRGDRSRHWSAECWILKCCVDDKGLSNCSQCGEFPCVKLTEWSKERPRTAAKRHEAARRAAR